MSNDIKEVMKRRRLRRVADDAEYLKDTLNNATGEQDIYCCIQPGNKVVFREGHLFLWCEVKKVELIGNQRKFTLSIRVGLGECGASDEITVSCNVNNLAYCPWRFMKASEVSDY